MTTARSPAVVAAVALAVRALAVLVSDRVVADVLRYRKVAAHVLDVSWNPYLAPRLYPYPAAWVWVEPERLLIEHAILSATAIASET